MKKQNAVTKAYKKKIQKAMGLTAELLDLLNGVPAEYEAGLKKQPPHYNVRLDGAMMTVKHCLQAVENALSEVNYDLFRENYVEGENDQPRTLDEALALVPRLWSGMDSPMTTEQTTDSKEVTK